MSVRCWNGYTGIVYTHISIAEPRKKMGLSMVGNERRTREEVTYSPPAAKISSSKLGQRRSRPAMRKLWYAEQIQYLKPYPYRTNEVHTVQRVVLHNTCPLLPFQSLCKFRIHENNFLEVISAYSCSQYPGDAIAKA